MPNQLISINPANGQQIGVYEISGEKKVERALKQARTAFEEWRLLPISKRGALLKSIAKELRKEKEHLARLASLEMGKPIGQGRDEVEKCARSFDYYARKDQNFLPMKWWRPTHARAT